MEMENFAEEETTKLIELNFQVKNAIIESNF